MEEVTLVQMLTAREARVQAQAQLLARFRCPIICFTMNIPGPVKDSPLIRRGFDAGWNTLLHRLPKKKVLHAARREAVTGCEALLAVDMDPVALKKLCTAIEDETRLLAGSLIWMYWIRADRSWAENRWVAGAGTALSAALPDGAVLPGVSTAWKRFRKPPTGS